MVWFIIAIVLAVLGIAGIVVAPRFKSQTVSNGYGREVETADLAPWIRWIGVAVATLGVVTFVLDVTVVVPTRTFGIETEFGQPVGTPLANGFHLIAPWANVDTTFEASVQTLRLSSAKDSDGPPITVRLANQTTAAVDVSVQWQLNANADVLTLYRQYKAFPNIQTNVVQRQLANALNKVFENFNPLATLDSNGNQTVHVTDLAAQVTAILQGEMPNGIEVDNVTIPLITYDAQIENQINSIIAAASATRVALQGEQTAKATQAANSLLAAGNLTPGVLYQNCLTMTQSALKAGESLPPGWSCGSPGASVVIPTK